MSCQTRWSFWRPLNDTRRFLELETLPNGFVNESNQHSQRKLLFICYQGLIQIYLSSQPVVILKSMAMSNSGRCVSQPAVRPPLVFRDPRSRTEECSPVKAKLDLKLTRSGVVELEFNDLRTFRISFSFECPIRQLYNSWKQKYERQAMITHYPDISPHPLTTLTALTRLCQGRN